MSRVYFDFSPISSLSIIDENNPKNGSYDFHHVALMYQLYMEDKTIVDEDEAERLRRSKLVTRLLAEIVKESFSMYKENISNAPADVQQWLQQVAAGRPAAMLDFCTQWAKSLHRVQHWNRGSCYLFNLELHCAASVQASCDLVEHAVKLLPELVEGTAQICKLGVLVNRAEAAAHEEKLRTATKELPVTLLPLPSD